MHHTLNEIANGRLFLLSDCHSTFHLDKAITKFSLSFIEFDLLLIIIIIHSATMVAFEVLLPILILIICQLL